MPGYLGGGSSGGSGVGGEIRFPKEFVDPVTKLRVSNPENLIDTDFEYGLQPTKWETLELINNTPSFFSKSGDTTIDNILSITTNQGTREIIVKTSQEHLLAVGIPINVQGSKSITADGAYIINSIPDPFTFTYLCKDVQPDTAAIQDLYTSIITGEFFQGSQLRISDDNGIVTNGASISTLTVTTDSTHGFLANTPFYFLNLNSAIAQEFQATNTASKSFDASNSATAQTFDGSNTLSSINIDFSNSATSGGTESTIQSVNTIDDTVTVFHTSEKFGNLTLGTPLYYNVIAGSGFFAANPRGVVFLKSTGGLSNNDTSTFQVSEVPDGPVIDLQGAMTGTFQIANQARTFAGNNRNPETEITLTVIKEEEIVFDGGNQGYDGEADNEAAPNGECTVLGYTGDSILVSTPDAASLDYYQGAMVNYSTSGAAATNLVNNATYFINSVTASATPGLYTLTIKELPDSSTILLPSGGSGTQIFEKIGVSVDKDIFHIRNAGFSELDLLEYSSFPENGAFTSEEPSKNFYFVTKAFDEHNFQLSDSAYSPTSATGGTVTQVSELGRLYNIHTFTTVGNSTFEVTSVGTDSTVEFLVVGGGGGGGMDMGGGGGGGGMIEGSFTAQSGTYSVAVGAGGRGGPRPNTQGQPGSHQYTQPAFNGSDTTVSGPGSLLLRAKGGGAGGSSVYTYSPESSGSAGGSGGGASGYSNNNTLRNGGIETQSTQGAATGVIAATMYGNRGGRGGRAYYSGGGGGAGGIGTDSQSRANGGAGRPNSILGTEYYWAGGGGGSGYSITGGDGGIGGGGGAAIGTTSGGSSALNPGQPGGGGSTNANANTPGGNAGANTGGGGGGAAHYQGNSQGGAGGSGIVIFRYPVTAFNPNAAPMAASGGTLSQITVTRADGVEIDYNVHAFTATGASTFTVSDIGELSNGQVEYLVVGGGGGTGNDMGGGGGGGGVLQGVVTLEPGTYNIAVGAGGPSSGVGYRGANPGGQSGQPSQAFGITALGGGGGAGGHRSDNQPAQAARVGASGGGASGRNANQAAGTPGQGFGGGTTGGEWYAGAGGGAGGPGVRDAAGQGKPSSILGTEYWFGGGGGASGYTNSASNGGKGGGGGGARWSAGSNGLGDTNGINPGGNGTGSTTNGHGGSGGANTGGGAGGHAHQARNSSRGGGSGIVVVRYPIAIRTGE